MIDKNDVKDFFDRCAKTWDAEMIRNDDIINTILDNCDVRENIHVLDVACGTGVLFEDYLKRSVASVTGIDISPEMIKRAAAGCSDRRVRTICGDIEETDLIELSCGMPDLLSGYDVVMVYNAFPHFPQPQKLIEKLASLTKPGGRMSVAHGMSRARIDAHHSGSARNVSNGLMSTEELRGLMLPYFDVDIVISDDRMYQVCGIRRD